MISRQNKRLTILERQAISLVLEGKSNKEIAAEIGTEEQNVKNRIRMALRKLGLRTCRQVIPRASEISSIVRST